MKHAFFSWRNSVLIALLGAISALSFAPGPLPAPILPFVQIAALACLAGYVLNAPTPGQSAWAGFLFGFGQFALGLYWIFISLHQYGGLPSPLAAGAVLVLAAGGGLYFALAGALARWLGNPSSLSRCRQLLDAAVWASCWAGAEWLRGTLFTGFPWLGTGYAHADGPLSGWAAVVGVYGLAWIAAYIAAALALLVRTRAKTGKFVLATAVVLALAGIGLKQISWSAPFGPPLQVRLVQGNVPQSEKFDPQLMQKGIETYMRLAARPFKETGAEPRLIVMPETIMPMFQDEYPPQVWSVWKAIAREQHASLLMGVPLHTREDGRNRYTNSAVALNADTPVEQLLTGTMPMRYDKHHLVPFGEFIPTGFHWFVNAMHIPLGDFNRGAARQRLFSLDGQILAPNICYEDIFGEEIIRAVDDSPARGPGATLLVNISNLAWFGDSWALRQHLQISRLRAMETARPIIRATNTGATAVIDSGGLVKALLPVNTMGVLDTVVQGTRGLTPYVRWGNAPVLAWLALILLMGLGVRCYRRKRTRH